MSGKQEKETDDGDISEQEGDFLTEDEVEKETILDRENKEQIGEGKKRGRPRGSKNKRNKEEGRKIEDMMNIFGKEDKDRRLLTCEVSRHANYASIIGTNGADPDKGREGMKEEGGQENEGKCTEGRTQFEEKEVNQKEILEFLKNQNKRMEENLKIMKETMTESVKEEGVNIREMFSREISKIKEDFKRREKEWVIEKKLMQTRIDKLEERAEMVEELTEERKMEKLVTKKVDRKIHEIHEMPQIQKEERWIRKMEENMEKVLREKSKEEAERLESMDLRLERNERTLRRVNMIIRGAGFEGRNLKREVENVMEEKLQAKEKVRRVSRLGNSESKNNTGILVQLETLEAKKRIMRNRYMLKGTRIYVDDDLTKIEREIHKRIWEQARKEEARGRKVKRGYMKLIIDGVCWRWEERRGKLVRSNF